MQILDDLENLPASLTASVVTVGKFFAVHVGHQALIRATRERAGLRGAASAVLTFDRHPSEVLHPGSELPVLTTLEERLELIAGLGVDYALVLHLDAAFMQQSPEEFVNGLLRERLRMVEVVASDNFRFGRGAAGTVETLQALGAVEGFTVTVVPPVLVRGVPVSSSRVATCVSEGRVDAAAELLGRPYVVPGGVVHGDRLGRQLGFPTANLAVAPRRLLPADGVYSGAARWRDRREPAVISVGLRPTVDGTRRLVEAYLLDFRGDLYGEQLALEFHRFLRPQERFASLDALKEQIAKDVEAARSVMRDS